MPTHESSREECTHTYMQHRHKYCIFIVASSGLKSSQNCVICVYWHKHNETYSNTNDMKNAELTEERIEYPSGIPTTHNNS